MKEMILIRNKEGVLNVDELKIVKQSKESDDGGKKKEEKPKNKKQSKEMKMQIDRMVLTVRKVIMKDYSEGEPPQVTGYDVGVENKEYKDIKSAEELSTIIMLTAMGPVGLKGAGIYGAATVLGVGLLPVGVAAVLVSSDTAVQEFNSSIENLYAEALKVFKKMGEGVEENKGNNLITGKIKGASVKIEVLKGKEKKSQIRITARKMMIPQKKVAEGLLYEISNNIK